MIPICEGVLRLRLETLKKRFPRSAVTHVQTLVPKFDVNEEDTFKNAKPFESIPGPSRLALFKAFMPGGRYYNKIIPEMFTTFRKDYGDIFLLPGLFGKPNAVFTFNPDDYRKVFRTEGIWPVRRTLDIVEYYRKVHRADIFQQAGGLVAEQGEGWAHFRKVVNPVMMNPKTTKFYIPRMDNVMKEFIQRIKDTRDPQTFEVPANFEYDMKHWAMDSACLVALDTEMGLINHAEKNPEAREVIDGMRDTFELMFRLDFHPSLWKFVPTPKFRRMVEKFDKMTMLSIKYIDAALERLATDDRLVKADSEKSVLESLLNIDRKVAITMAMDILMAGVDTISSALTGALLVLSSNPKKQDILRQEVLSILPEKDTSLTVEKMKNMPYLRACIKESMRMYPVSTGNFRTTGRDLVLSGYQIPKGTHITMPSQAHMRDESYYPRANEFLPERWLREESESDCPMAKNVNPFVFLPFGFGPRMCIGRRIVDLELETAICRLVRNFHIQYDYPLEEAKFIAHIVNVPDFPMRFKFKDVKE